MTFELTGLVNRAAEQFAARFERPASWIVAAPGRVNLIGEHIDYSDGFVLPMAIERYCVIAAGEAEEGRASVFSATTGEEALIPLPPVAPHHVTGHWSNYVAGVLAGWAERVGRLPGFVAVCESNVPIGGGLSSSASLEVATATLLEAMTDDTLEPDDKALLCQRAEHEYPGVPCGIMDQFASVFGRRDHLMLLDCRSRQIEYIPLVDPQITVLIVNSNVRHELTGSEYAERREQCESVARKLGLRSMRDATLEQLNSDRLKIDAIEFRRARHAITEIARTIKAAEAIRASDWDQIGALMYASHKSLRDDYEVSCPELDLLVDLAQDLGKDKGVIGARMTGGGFGGCTVNLVDTQLANAVAEKIADAYQSKTGITPTLLTSRPAMGAHRIR